MTIKAFAAPIVMIENPIQFGAILDVLGQQFELSSGQHTESQLKIREDLPGAQFIAGHRFQFIEAPMFLNRGVDIFMKVEYFLFRRLNSLPDGQLSLCIHNGGHVYTVGTLTGTGVAPYADPDGVAGQGFMNIAEPFSAPDVALPHPHIDDARLRRRHHVFIGRLRHGLFDLGNLLKFILANPADGANPFFG